MTEKKTSLENHRQVSHHGCAAGPLGRRRRGRRQRLCLLCCFFAKPEILCSYQLPPMRVQVFWMHVLKCSIQNPLPYISHICNANYFCEDRHRRGLKTFFNLFLASFSSSAYAGFVAVPVYFFIMPATMFTFVLRSFLCAGSSSSSWSSGGCNATVLFIFIFIFILQGLFLSADTLAACQISWICI